MIILVRGIILIIKFKIINQIFVCRKVLAYKDMFYIFIKEEIIKVVCEVCFAFPLKFE